MSLPAHQAFRPGTDLWILPDMGNSSWSCRLDWYFNGSISRAENHSPSRISDSLRELMKEEEIESLQTDFKREALLISIDRFVPSKRALVIQYTGDLEAWLNKALQYQKSLGEKTSRIFLPRGTPTPSPQKLKAFSDFPPEFISDEEP